ncbi:unnamed protein product [Vitrella brassicaformis CCMP3155]|uniref:RRM domain-containing protein n=1 Tax=Vitrella brassicaformis (strain CCMP3155) TaxID=1169540 RepID=A0A0G4G1K5_VITBC|nr:unnamed protein product [Vitrella brassicaformis CCMP3155]|eukprot:CEM21922.1 unnamed protein product [Vitrella brassicaformis CCMP3155]
MPSNGAFVRLRGLPYSASEQDIVSFMLPLQCQNQDVTIVQGPDGRATGEAFVRFNTDAEADQALSKNRHHLGTRYIEIFRSTATEYDRYVKQTRGDMGGYGMGGPPGPHDHPGGPHGGAVGVLRMRGLPWSATYLDIIQFFQRFNVKAEDVVIGTTLDGRPSGEAWVQFDSESTAEQARMELNKQTMGSRYIELFPSTKAEMVHAQQPRGFRPGMGMGGGGGYGGMGPGGPGYGAGHRYPNPASPGAACFNTTGGGRPNAIGGANVANAATGYGYGYGGGVDQEAGAIIYLSGDSRTPTTVDGVPLGPTVLPRPKANSVGVHPGRPRGRPAAPQILQPPHLANTPPRPIHWPKILSLQPRPGSSQAS